MDELHGPELSEGVFHFCRCFRELKLNEKEFALVLPLHLLYDGRKRRKDDSRFDRDFSGLDSSIEDGHRIQMLRLCYRYALFMELCQNRGETEAKIMCRRISQVCSTIVFFLVNNDCFSRFLNYSFRSMNSTNAKQLLASSMVIGKSFSSDL